MINADAGRRPAPRPPSHATAPRDGKTCTPDPADGPPPAHVNTLHWRLADPSERRQLAVDAPPRPRAVAPVGATLASMARQQPMGEHSAARASERRAVVVRPAATPAARAPGRVNTPASEHSGSRAAERPEAKPIVLPERRPSVLDHVQPWLQRQTDSLKDQAQRLRPAVTHAVRDIAADPVGAGRTAARVVAELARSLDPKDNLLRAGLRGAQGDWHGAGKELLGAAHEALDILGYVPGAGAVPDLVNAGVYLLEGDKTTAGLSAITAIPLVGDLIGGGKKIARSADAAVAGARAAPGDAAPVLFGQRRLSPNFGTEGRPQYLAGRSITEVADDLRQGTLHPDQLPVQVFRLGGQLVAANTRSLAALSEAGLRPTVVEPIRPTAKILARLRETPIISNAPLPGPRVPVTPSIRELDVMRVIELPRQPS